LRERFPDEQAYHDWFLKLIGILGDVIAGKELIDWSRQHGVSFKGHPFDYPRAFTYSPTEDQLQTLYDLLEWTWHSAVITFCDPMAGGGSVPFEALRYGLTVHANELNPVASVILKAVLDYPSRLGPSFLKDLRNYGKKWQDIVHQRLSPFFVSDDREEDIYRYFWARTVACPVTGKPVPLSPNWWLRKGTDPIAVRVIANPKDRRCRFEIARGRSACSRLQPDKGTVKRGSGISPWTGDPIDGDYIKAEAQAGRMGQQLFAISFKKGGQWQFRTPTSTDESAYAGAEEELARLYSSWESQGLIPTEPRREGRADWACEIYGTTRWCDTYAPRQLLAMMLMLESLDSVIAQASKELDAVRSSALRVYLSLAFDKAADYNSKQVCWHASREVIVHAFTRHDLSMRWSFAECEASRNLMPWILEQIEVAYQDLARLVERPLDSLFRRTGQSAVDRLAITSGGAQCLKDVDDASVVCITVDPPYYDNVNYAECSNYFYVWMKRTLGSTFNGFFTNELANEDDEAVMNVARFRASGKKARNLAIADYENKMLACFREMNRILAPQGVLTVMFTHKQVEAWDTLGSSLIRAGFQIGASWPVHTESEKSLHQAKKNAAASTILLVCRKRDSSTEPVWWDDLKGKVRQSARQKAAEFEAQGIKGVDLYISTFGPVLSIISENWPVLTSQSDPKTGNPLSLKPGDALDLAREEVINLRKQGLLLGRSIEFDPVTDWYLMAWDAFRAQEFPADEARKLALALGLDLERDIVRDKRLVSKKSGTVVICQPADRRKKNMVDTDAEPFPHLIDALHTAMMVYEAEGSKACQVFVDRRGLRTDSRGKALVQAMMQAIPTTRGKDGKFLRPEMSTLDALRMLFWEDLPAPKEEEPPKIDPQRALFDKGTGDNEADVEEEPEDEEDIEE